MFCKNCSTEYSQTDAFCQSCGKITGEGKGFCNRCGKSTDPNLTYCVNCGANQGAEQEQSQKNTYTGPNYQQSSYTGPNYAYSNNANNQVQQKSKLIAIVLALFLGVFGLHNFYMGYNTKAICQIIATVLTCGTVTTIWAIIDVFLIALGSVSTDADGIPLKD